MRITIRFLERTGAPLLTADSGVAGVSPMDARRTRVVTVDNPVLSYGSGEHCPQMDICFRQIVNKLDVYECA